jgi:hypothetical protein
MSVRQSQAPWAPWEVPRPALARLPRRQSRRRRLAWPRTRPGQEGTSERDGKRIVPKEIGKVTEVEYGRVRVRVMVVWCVRGVCVGGGGGGGRGGGGGI